MSTKPPSDRTHAKGVPQYHLAPCTRRGFTPQLCKTNPIPTRLMSRQYRFLRNEPNFQPPIYILQSTIYNPMAQSPPPCPTIHDSLLTIHYFTKTNPIPRPPDKILRTNDYMIRFRTSLTRPGARTSLTIGIYRLLGTAWQYINSSLCIT